MWYILDVVRGYGYAAATRTALPSPTCISDVLLNSALPTISTVFGVCQSSLTSVLI